MKININIQEHKSLRELVYDRLHELIVNGDIKPGTRLMEVDLAEKLGVSRTPVREAIRKLEREGLVIIKERKGAYVSDISIRSMIDILEVQSNLEGLAAYLAAYRMDKGQQEELFQIEKEFEKAVDGGDVNQISKVDEEFHRRLVQSSENAHLIHLLEQLNEHVIRFRYLYYQDIRRVEEMIPEHQSILDAIVESRAEKARNAAYSHIDKLKDMVLRGELQ